MPAFVIIGTGRAGSAVARLLVEKGWQAAGLFSRTGLSARQLATTLAGKEGEIIAGVPTEENLVAACSRASVVFLTVPDDFIASTAGYLAEIFARNSLFLPGKLFLHMSGSRGLEELMPLKEMGALVAALHPLQSLPGEGGEKVLPGAWMAVEGTGEAGERAEQIARLLGGKVFSLPSGGRAFYHAAACVASNYFVVLMDYCLLLMEKAGLAREQALEAVEPLVMGTWSNLRRLGPEKALTGPVVRGDVGTVAKHLQALAAEGWDGFYRTLARAALELARRGGRIEGDKYLEMGKLLDGEKGQGGKKNEPGDHGPA